MTTSEFRACNGTYVRDPNGTWRYPWAEAVPGARDLVLCDVMTVDPSSSVETLVERFRPLTEDELAWLAGARGCEGEIHVRRQGSRPAHAGDLIVGLQAPELHIQAMMTVGDIAEAANVSKATIDSYRYRGYLPEPQIVCGRTPLWARPIVQRWLARRPGCGWRSDVYGSGPVRSRQGTARTERTASGLASEVVRSVASNGSNATVSGRR